MDPWNQLCFMDPVHVGEFVLAYLLNPTSYGHETCTIGYSKDWSLKGCVKVLWQLHQIWSYGPVKSAMFHGFGLGWLICGTISLEPYKLWTWDLYHWIQQRLTFKWMCRNNCDNPISFGAMDPWNQLCFMDLVNLGWLICGTIFPEPYKLWTWDLYHWIQQRLRFKRFCRNIVINPSGLELWAPDFNHVS